MDAFSPREVAARVEDVGVAKARLPLFTSLLLGVLAGGFIGLGALLSTLVLSDDSLGFAASRLLAGISFSLGLILVVVAGAELFTGNNLLVMAWTAGKISTGELVVNWTVVLAGNFLGASGLAVLVTLSNVGAMNQGGVAASAVEIAAAKAALPFWDAFFRGVLCNVLVCLGVWMAMAGRSVTDKVLAIIFPISAFVAAGFEHSVANLYFLSAGILLRNAAPAEEISSLATLDWVGFGRSFLAVALGNVVGGSGMVALVYHLAYRRGVDTSGAP